MDENLKSVLADVFGLRESEIHSGLTKEDVDSWDSLKQMDLVLSLEKEYDLALEIPDILRMMTVAGILEVLVEKGVSLEN